MKKWFWILLVLVAVAKLPAQTNRPVQLALIAESDETTTAADVLTAQLSDNPKIHLLERDEIEKVYHEQGMSAANRNDLKLGRILGADGLLLLDIVRTPQTTNLTARLIAVKPGVVLTDGSFPWPPKDIPQWAESAATRLNSFLPKLTVLTKDAIPISIVNLRAAVSSADEQETELDLKLLTIQRLSEERQLFVLERQKMQLLSEEKELKSDESAFWNGSYLLDGTVDQNGYSPETVTITARLIPPKGGAPLLFEVSGSRTNLSEVVNHLAGKVTELLNVHSTVPEWNATNEAAQFFEEAKWALRWGVYSEAQAAADSAWALGKGDLDCASVRVKSYILQVPPDTSGFQEGTFFTSGSPDNGSFWIKNISSQGHDALIFNKRADQIDYVTIDGLPNPKNIDYALHALELYYAFSRSSPEGEPKALWSGPGWNDWHNSDWYNIGIEDLIAASKVLQYFNLVPPSQPPVADKLLELRALARSVDELISKSPSVHDSYFVGNRIATYDELAYTIGEEKQENSSIFSCEVTWGCFWQEKPEDCIALYHELMSSPAFCYLHTKLWRRNPAWPRVVAWNNEDRRRIPEVWNDFVHGLNDSTNILLQMEGRALAVIDAKDDSQLELAFNGLMEDISSNREELVENNVDLFYLDWRVGDLLFPSGESYTLTPALDRLENQCRTNFFPKLEAMDQEYRAKTVPAGQFRSFFEKQKQYLKENRPFDFFEFVHTFSNGGGPNYSKAQALEIEPLLEGYKSNLTAQSESASGMQKGLLMSAIAQVGFVENDVKRSLDPPAPQLRLQPTPPAPQPALALKVAAAVPAAIPAPEIANNVIEVNKFIPIPKDRIIDLGNFERISPPGIDITVIAHHWFERKLFLNFQYSASIDLLDEKGTAIGGRNVAGSAIAIFNSDTESWDMVNCPEISEISLFELRIKSADNRLALFQGELFSSENGPLQEFNFQKREWRNLEIPEQDGYELFTVAGHLFATDDNTILEITDGGRRTRVLASTRRRPVKSALDSLDNLGSPSPFAGGKPLPPELFSISDHSIYADIGNKIFSWDGNDWHELSMLNLSQPPEIFQDAVIFRSIPSYSSDSPANLWIWEKNQPAPELALSDGPKPHPGIINFRPSGGINPTPTLGDQPSHPLWKSPAGNYLTDWAATFYQTNLYFFVDHCIVTNMFGHWTVAEQNGYHAQLVCLSRKVSRPIIVPLKFDLDHGQPPLKSLGEQIEPELAFRSSALATAMYFSRNTLFLSQRNTPGVWAIPISEIETAIAEQKQARLAGIAQEAKQASTEEERQRKVREQQHRDLLAKYDLNHNGRIDPEEREAALADPAFIESELDVIDANHNGLLDPEELAYFDPDKNKILEPHEQAGIDIAEHLSAERLFKKLDVNGDGALDQSEFDNLQAHLKTDGAFMADPPQNVFVWDDNHNGVIEDGELESFLKQQLRYKLRPRGMAGAVFFRQLTADPNTAIDPRHMFKAEVEFYWQSSVSPAKETPEPNPHWHVP